MAEAVQVARLAMRLEGKWWVGYYALPDTMLAAIELGRVHMHVVQDAERKAAFMALLRSFMDEELANAVGHSPDHWEMQPAPESERSGSA